MRLSHWIRRLRFRPFPAACGPAAVTRARRTSRRSQERHAGHWLAEVLEDRALLSSVTVSPGAMGDWAIDVRDVNGDLGNNPTAGAAFVTGPATPPVGTGSLNLFTGNGVAGGDGAAELRNTFYDGTPLSDLTALSYDTYASVWNGQQLPYLGLELDLDGDSQYDDIIFFEPAYQTPTSGNPSLPDQGSEALNTWQHWDALAGGWWSSSSIASADPGTGVKSLADYLAVEPNATIVNRTNGLGGVRITVGFASDTDVFSANVDNITIGTTSSTTFDFEDVTPANVSVNSAWAGTNAGLDPDGPGPATVYGEDAFSTIQEGIDAVAPSGTVNIATGSYTENVSTAGNDVNVAPGGAAAAQVTINGDLTLDNSDSLTLQVDGSNPITDYDQLNVNGLVNLGGADLNLSGSVSGNPGQQIVLINNDGTDPITGTFSNYAEGDTVTINGIDFILSYVGGADGNDVTLTEAGPISYGSDGAGPGQLELRVVGNQLQFVDDGVVVDSRPLSTLVGQTVTIDGSDPGNDTLLIDYAAYGFLPFDIVFNGGSGAGGTDTLIVNGGTFTTVTNTFTTTGPENSGNIVFDTGSQTATITYTGLEPVDMTGSTVTDVVLNLPTGVHNDFNLQDDGDLTNGLIQIVSNNAQFETTTFVAPTGSLVINGAAVSDYFHLYQLDNAAYVSGAPITFNAGAGVDRMYVHTNAASSTIPSGGLSLVGAGNNDAFTLFSGYSATDITHTLTGAGSGSVNIDGNVITYSGLSVPAGIYDQLATVNRLFQFSGTSDTITFGDDPVANDGFSRIASTASSVVVDFKNPSGTFALNGGDGNDVINVGSFAGLDAQFTAPITIDGEGNTDTVHLNTTSVFGDLTVTAETVDQSAAMTVSGTATFDTVNDLLLVNPANDFNIVNATSNGVVAVAEANDITLNDITSEGLSATAKDVIDITGTLDAGAGLVDLSANTDGAGASSLTMQPGSSIVTTNNGSLAVLINVNTIGGGTGDATLTSVSAGTTSGVISLSVVRGAIIDGNTGTTNLTAWGATLLGSEGVGSFVDPLETTVSALEAYGGDGGIFVNNTGALSIGGVSGMVGLMAITGNIDVSTGGGALTVEEDVTSNANITLTAIDNASVGNDLTVNSTIIVQSTQANVTLRPGDNITLQTGSTIVADGAINITSDFGDADAGTGTTLNVAAQLVSGTGTTITGGADNDTYAISYPDGATNSGTVTIVDGGGTDAVIVNGASTAEELFLTTTEPPTTATTEQVTRGTAVDEPIVIPSSIESLRINGGAGNDIFHIEPSMLFPVTIDGQSPQFGDPGVPPGDALDLITFGNTFTIQDCNVIYVAGGVPQPYQGITFQSIENFNLTPVSTGPAWRFDLNDRFVSGNAFVQSATQSGFTGVTAETLYATSGLGYGWDQPMDSYRMSALHVPEDTSAAADLLNDGHQFAAGSAGQPRTFTADVGNGWVLVTVTFGSPYGSLNGLEIRDGDSGAVMASDLSSTSLNWNSVTFPMLVTDGSANLEFEDMTGPYRRISINGIEIRPADTFMGMGFAVPGPLDADGTTIDNFLLAAAPANALVTVTPELGTLVGTDADSRLDGFQILTDASGNATIQIQRPSAAGTSCVDLQSPTGEKSGLIIIDYTRVNTQFFDFNDDTNPITQTGYTPVQTTDLYADTIGYGWMSMPDDFSIVPPLGGVTSDLLSDGHRSGVPKTFRVDLDNGSYEVHLLMGDSGDHQSMTVVANAMTVVDHQPVARNQILDTTFVITISGGVLDLAFSQQDTSLGDPHWVVNALEIRPISIVDSITPINVGSVPADGSTSTTINATSTLSPGTEVTVSSSLGTITTADVDAGTPGIQVLVGAGGAISFDLQSPSSAGVPTLQWMTLDGMIKEKITDATFLNFIAIPGASRKFDFGEGFDASTASPIAAGYTGVLPNQTSASTDGYGWTSVMQSFNSYTTVPFAGDQSLLRDGVLSQSGQTGTFQFSVAPGANYNLLIYVGRYGQTFDQVQVAAEGASPVTTGIIHWYEYGTILASGAHDTNNDGLIDVVFSDAGGFQTGWAIMGMNVDQI